MVLPCRSTSAWLRHAAPVGAVLFNLATDTTTAAVPRVQQRVDAGADAICHSFSAKTLTESAHQTYATRGSAPAAVIRVGRRIEALAIAPDEAISAERLALPANARLNVGTLMAAGPAVAYVCRYVHTLVLACYLPVWAVGAGYRRPKHLIGSGEANQVLKDVPLTALDQDDNVSRFPSCHRYVLIWLVNELARLMNLKQVGSGVQPSICEGNCCARG
jgi:hypothetical protein